MAPHPMLVSFSSVPPSSSEIDRWQEQLEPERLTSFDPQMIRVLDRPKTLFDVCRSRIFLGTFRASR
jgi:hypothetical protein